MKKLSDTMTPNTYRQVSDRKYVPCSPQFVTPTKRNEIVSCLAQWRSKGKNKDLNSAQLKMHKTMLYFIKKYEEKQLKEKFKTCGIFTFAEEGSRVEYSNESDLEKIMAELMLYDYKCLDGPKIQNLRALTRCSFMEKELEHKGFRLATYDGELYLQGRNTYAREINEIRDEIYSHYCHELKYFYYKKELSKKEKENYQCIFSHLNDFEAIRKTNLSELVSIEPKLEEVKGNKWTLSFIVLAKKMINFKELCRQIYDAINGMQCITLIISTPKKEGGMVNQYFRYKQYTEIASKQTRLLVTFKRELVDRYDIGEYIKQIETNLGCTIQGVVYDESEIKLKREEAITYAELIGCTIHEGFRGRTRNICALLPTDGDKCELIMLLIKLSQISELPREIRCLSVHGNNNFSDDGRTDRSIRNLINEIESQDPSEDSYLFEETENSQNNEELPTDTTDKNQQEEQQDNLFFECGNGNAPIVTKENGSRYKRREVFVSGQFMSLYDQIEEAEQPIAIVSYPVKSLTLRTCRVMNNEVGVMPLEEAFNAKLSFYEGFYKKKEFETGTMKCLAVRPHYSFEYIGNSGT